MDLIIGLIVAVKSLVFMGGYISPDKLPVRISGMQVNVAQNDIRVGCTVANAFTTDLKNLAQSSTPILLYVFIDVKRADNDSVVASVVAENRLVYDLAAKKYSLSRSISRDSLSLTAVDPALAAASSFPLMPVLTKDRIVRDRSYYFILWAVLGKTRVEALENKNIDLMYFWDYKRPALRTDPFAGAQLLATPDRR